MSRKHDPKKIHLEITYVELFTTTSNEGAVIGWCSDIGFGEYTIRHDESGNIYGYSECMDINEDKAFLEELLTKLKDIIIEKIDIRE